MPMRWESSSASSRWWVVRRMLRSGDRMALRIAQMDWRELGSRPEDGSSRKMNFDLPIRALASESFLLLPPERFFDSFSASAWMLHSAMTESIS